MKRPSKKDTHPSDAALADDGGPPEDGHEGAAPGDAGRAAAPEDVAEGESTAELRDKWLRSMAEAENARKRATTEVREARLYGSTAVLHELLPVLDNLQRALAHPPAGLDPPFLEGLRLIEQQWAMVLARHGVQSVPAEPGQPFDPSVHRVVLETETGDHPPGTIVSEVVRGYRLHDRLLREGQVVVARAPTAPDDDAGRPGAGRTPDGASPEA